MIWVYDNDQWVLIPQNHKQMSKYVYILQSFRLALWIDYTTPILSTWYSITFTYNLFRNIILILWDTGIQKFKHEFIRGHMIICQMKQIKTPKLVNLGEVRYSVKCVIINRNYLRVYFLFKPIIEDVVEYHTKFRRITIPNTYIFRIYVLFTI